MSAVQDAARIYAAVACYTIGWSKKKGAIALPWAYPASDACLARGDEVKNWVARSLLDVLVRRHARDTWFQAVTMPGAMNWPRLAKALLLEEEARARFDGAGLAYAVIDLDRPDHSISPWESTEAAAEAVRETHARLDCSVYATRGGLRCVWVLDRVVPLSLSQSFLNRFHANLPDDLPVSVDQGVKDWTRGYRVPWCPRADGKVAPWGDAAPPMQLAPMRDGAVFHWSEDGLTDETVFRVSPVDWRAESTSDRNTKRVQKWFEAQLVQVTSAASRHHAIRAKARALGGLCRGALDLAANPGAVDPEPMVQALINATGSGNAERTVRQALDYGANEPWWFEVDEPTNVIMLPNAKTKARRAQEGPIAEHPDDPGLDWRDERIERGEHQGGDEHVDGGDVFGMGGDEKRSDLPPELDRRCLPLPYTDLGNARRFAYQHGDAVRWCSVKGSWLVWLSTHWAWDDREVTLGYAHATVDAIALEAKEHRACADATDDEPRKTRLKKQAEEAYKHYIRSQSSGRIDAIMKQARGLPGIPVSTDNFDTDSWLLGVQNGTIELQQQRFREHRRSDLITRLAPVVYDPAAKCPAWDTFITEVFPEEDVRYFVQRAIGYSLTGDISQQVWFLLQGEGSNGKSTLLETISALLGTYATTLPAGSLEARENDAHPTEATGLHRARFASGTEPRAKRSWDSEKIKRQTGGDIIEARYMHGDFFYFAPTHKLWVSCNDMPKSDDMGTGFWRRVVIIPFTQRWYREDEEGLPKVDPDLPSRLKQELAGILNWALEGLRDFREGGLCIPAACRLAVKAYKQEQDEIGRFIAERCDLSTSAMDTRSVSTADLYGAYRRWRDGEGLDGKPVSNVVFGRQLTQRFKLGTKTVHGRTHRAGITLRDLSMADESESSEVSSSSNAPPYDGEYG